MRGIRKMKMERQRIPIYLLLIGVFMVGLLALRWGMMAEAEGEYEFVIDGISKQSYTLKERTKEIRIRKGVIDCANVEWSVEDSDIAMLRNERNNPVIIQAKGVGETTLNAKVSNGVDTSTETVSIRIKVECAIDKSDSCYKNVSEESDEKALILAVGETDEVNGYKTKFPLKLSTGNESDYDWVSDNPAIASVDNVENSSTKGTVTAIASGHTKITVSKKNAQGTGTTEVDTVDVYVMPRIKVDDGLESLPGGTSQGSIANVYSIKSGAKISIDTQVLQHELLVNQLSWKVCEYGTDGSTLNIIADSMGEKKDPRISFEGITGNGSMGKNYFTINAKAQTYVLQIYPTDFTKLKEDFVPTTVILKVLPEFDANKDITVCVGDEVDFLDILNVQANDLQNPVIVIDNEESDTYKYYFSIDQNDYKLVAKKETGNRDITMKITAKSMIDNSTSRPYETTFSIRIVDPVILGVSEVMLRVGETMDLSKAIASIGDLSNGYKASDYTWSIVTPGDDQYVAIDDQGIIKGLKSTDGKQNPDYVVVKASLKLNSGVIKTATCKVYVSKAVDRVEISGNSIMYVDDTQSLKVNFFSDDNSEVKPKGNVTWKSSNSEIVEIKESDVNSFNPNIVAKKTGTAILTVLNEKYMTIGIFEIKVEVKVKGIAVAMDGKEVSKQTVEVSRNREYINLTALIKDPAGVNASDVSLEWVGADNTIVGIEDKSRGVIELKQAGTTRIKVTCLGDTSVNDYIDLVIRDNTQSITLTKTEVIVNVGEKIAAIPYTLQPVTAKPTLKWYSMDPKIAMVDEKTGEITGVKVGTTNLLVVTSDGQKAECIIHVEQPVDSIKFLQTELTISKGSSLPLLDSTILQMTPAGTTKRPSWNSFEPGIASVDQNGIVTGVEPGTTYVTASIMNKNGELLTESIKINVIDSPSGIAIDKEEYIVDVGGTVDLTYHLTPSNATTTVKWRSLDTSIAAVDEATGIVTGVKVGWTYIVAASEDGCYDTCIVYVRKQATGVDIVRDEEEVEIGKSKQILYSLAPDIEATGSLSWNCSDTSIATVDADGVVTGVKIGTAFIVVTGIDSTGQVYSDTCRIKVVQAATDIVLEQEVYTVEVNGTTQITYHFEPTSESSAELSWGMLDPTIATVDEKGIVTGVKIGTTYAYVNGTDPNGNIFSKSCRIDVVQMATGMKLNAEKCAVEVGKTQQIEYTLEPDKDSYMALTWSVIDPNVATVDNKGVVTGVNVGTTHVIVTGLGVSATCTIEVYQSAETLTFTQPSITLDVGETVEAAYTLTPATATNHTLNWSSQNAAIVSVDASGKLTGVSQGVTTVFANLPNGYVSYLTVNVIAKAKGMELDPASAELVKGDKLKIKPVFTPADATNKKVTWSSSNEAVATIDENGKVTAVAGGITMITGISEDGNFSGSSMITVTEAVTSVKLNHSSYKLVKGRSVTLKATVDSNTATNSKVKWTTSNKKIATVTQSGKVTGKNIGTCTIKVTAKDGSKRSASCKIRVIRVAKGLEINKTYLRVMEGTTAKLKTRFTPKNASIKHLKWETSDETIATITSKGIITGVTPGTCTVTAKTTDGSNIKVSCIVNVYERVPSTGVTVAASDLIIVKGMTQSAGATVSPANTTDKIRYYSDNKSVATVSSKGKIKARKPGNATITVSVGDAQEAYISVSVVDLNKTSLTMEQYDAEDLWVEGIEQKVKWSSSNPAVARVENGSVVARRVGNCTITASLDGVKLYCKVRVNRIRRR